MQKLNDLTWSFGGIWNNSLAQREKRALEPREHLWASELGGSFIDRWYKMRAVKPSNPFTPQALRKFEAGYLHEWIVEMVLRKAGIWIESQKRCEFQIKGLPKVTGYLDHKAGGSPDWEKAKVSFEEGILPEFIKKAAQKVIEHLATKYPTGLRIIILEVKSVGSQRFHSYETFKIPQQNHKLQIGHYLLSEGMNEGHLIYVSKDDLCMVEIGVFNNQALKKEYEDDVRIMNEYLKSDQPPPKEPFIIFDDVEGRFTANYKVGYSNYLTLIYKIKDLTEFNNTYSPIVARWNRVLGRIVRGDKMTANNEAAISEIRKDYDGFEFNRILAIAKEKKAILENGGGEEIND